MIRRHTAGVEGACADGSERVPIRDSDRDSRALDEAAQTISQLTEEAGAPAVSTPAYCNGAGMKSVAGTDSVKEDSGGRTHRHVTGSAYARDAELPKAV